MIKSEQYNLYFSVYQFDGINIPRVGVSSINGRALNCEIASFLEPNGLENIDSIIFDIQALLLNNHPVYDVNVWGYHDAESVEIRHYPPSSPVAVFNSVGVEVIVPIADFIEILEEWKAFVSTVPTPHWLENR